MKTLVNRFFCWLLKRHTIEYMKANGGTIHNFYGVRGAGKMCTCPRCGKFVVVLLKEGL